MKRKKEIFGVITSVIVGLICILAIIDKTEPTILFWAILLTTTLAICAYWFCLRSKAGEVKEVKKIVLIIASVLCACYIIGILTGNFRFDFNSWSGFFYLIIVFTIFVSWITLDKKRP